MLLYSNKKMALLLVGIVLMISLFAGCRSDNDKDKDENTKDPVVTDSNASGNNNTTESGGNKEGSNGGIDNTDKGQKVTNEDTRLIKDVDIESIPVPNEPSTSNYIQLKVDKNQGEVGDIIRAEININLAANFAGYQINIKYDPEVLQPVNYDTHEPFGKGTKPSGATILTNQDFLPMNLADNDTANGILNFGTTYTNYPDYKESGTAEKSGVLGVIGFKILKKETTVIGFENSEAMPTGKLGTMLFNWDGNRLSSYEVVGVQKIN
jgi:hypothetical protein